MKASVSDAYTDTNWQWFLISFPPDLGFSPDQKKNVKSPWTVAAM